LNFGRGWPITIEEKETLLHSGNMFATDNFRWAERVLDNSLAIALLLMSFDRVVSYECIDHAIDSKQRRYDSHDEWDRIKDNLSTFSKDDDRVGCLFLTATTIPLLVSLSVANSIPLPFLMKSKSKPKKRIPPEQDQHLRELIRNERFSDWPAITQQIEGKTPRQCRERYQHYLALQYGRLHGKLRKMATFSHCI
jgi:hypothetical protein